MADELQQPPAHGTTYGRQMSKWNHTTSAKSGQEGPSPRIIVAIVLAVVLLIFILRNGHPTTINFLFFSWDTTVRWSLFITLLLGIALDRLIIWGMHRRKSQEQAPTPQPDGDDHS